MDEEKVERGNSLFAPFNADVTHVASLEFDVRKYHNHAVVKSWAKNHGLTPAGTPVTKAKTVSVRVRPDAAFEVGSLETVEVARGVTASIGQPKAVTDVELVDLEPPVEPDSPDIEPVERSVSLKGDLVPIARKEADPEKSVRVIGIVAKPEDPDYEGTVISVEEIERANFGFMKDFGTMGLMHEKSVTDVVRIIQNVIAPVDFDFPLPDGTTKSITAGTWYQELYTEDETLVERIRGGSITGLSLGGFARIERFEDEE